jgi:hypothetical protein
MKNKSSTSGQGITVHTITITIINAKNKGVINPNCIPTFRVIRATSPTQKRSDRR